MGALDHVAEYFNCGGGRHHYSHKRRKQLQTVEIKVKIDCEGCERKVRRSVEGMKGVTQVDIEPKQSKLTVVGYVEPYKVLARVKHRTGKRAEIWPYVPYEMVGHPYAPGVYDRKAPAGYVRRGDEQYGVGNQYVRSGDGQYGGGNQYVGRGDELYGGGNQYVGRGDEQYGGGNQYVRRGDGQYGGGSQLARMSSTEVRYTSAFSDENTSACSIM